MAAVNILLLILKNKHAQGILIGLIAGYFIGSLWVGKSGDEMMRQMVQAIMIARGM